MKKTMTLLLLALALTSLSAATVYVGGEVGINSNYIIAGSGYSGYEYLSAGGLDIRVPVVVEFTPNIALETGASFQTKPYGYTKSVTVKGEKNDIFGYDEVNSFIEIPLSLRLSIDFGGSRWGAFATLGGYCGYWVYGFRTGVAYGLTSGRPVEEKTDLSYYNRFEAGLSASVGADVEFGSFDAYLLVGYSIALTDMNKSQKYASYPVHNSTVTVAAGLLWGVNK